MREGGAAIRVDFCSGKGTNNDLKLDRSFKKLMSTRTFFKKDWGKSFLVEFFEFIILSEKMWVIDCKGHPVLKVKDLEL